MNFIEQPRGTQNCGQCVAAMLSGRTLDAAIELMGEGYTSVESLTDALARFDIVLMPNGSTTSERDLPVTPGAILIEICNSKGKTFKHWVAWDGREIFDPKFGKRKTLQRSSEETIHSALFFYVQTA